MKYLIYFKPNTNLQNLILKQDNVIINGPGVHSTICVFYMGPEKEEKLIADLKKINFEPFEIETLDFCDFDDNALVIRLSRPNSLLKLHKELIDLLRMYADSEFEATVNQYYWDKYSPHITVSKSSSEFDRNQKELMGQKDIFSSFFLAKKQEEVWKEVCGF